MSELDTDLGHVLLTLGQFQSPPTARALVDQLCVETSMDRERAQRALRCALDRGWLKPGKGLRIEYADAVAL